MHKKLLAGFVAGVASVAMMAAPSFAAVTDPGVLVTINSGGGLGLNDGLKLDIAYGQIQIGRNGSGQLYDESSTPSAANPDDMENFFVVALSDGANTTFIGNRYPSASGTGSRSNWSSFTSESVLTDGNKSGVVINHLKYGAGTSEVLLDVTWTYTYPNQFFNVTADLQLGSDYIGAGKQHRIYWYTDSYLEGSDSGNQFGGITPAGQEVAGVASAAGTQIEAFRQVSGQSLKWFAGEYECPWDDPTDPPFSNVEVCGTASGAFGYVSAFADFPNVPAPATLIDNGFGVNSASSSAASNSITFDLVFASCLTGVSALPCADSATGKETLANTGVDTSSMIALGLGAAILAALGVVLVVVRRRRA